MKTYGWYKATEISRKQIGVIYRMAKEKKLHVTRFAMNNLYDLADYYDYDDNRSAESAERLVKAILDDVFAGRIDEAQAKLDEYEEHLQNACSRKVLAKANMELV